MLLRRSADAAYAWKKMEGFQVLLFPASYPLKLSTMVLHTHIAPLLFT